MTLFCRFLLKQNDGSNNLLRTLCSPPVEWVIIDVHNDHRIEDSFVGEKRQIWSRQSAFIVLRTSFGFFNMPRRGSPDNSEDSYKNIGLVGYPLISRSSWSSNHSALLTVICNESVSAFVYPQHFCFKRYGRSGSPTPCFELDTGLMAAPSFTSPAAMSWGKPFKVVYVSTSWLDLSSTLQLGPLGVTWVWPFCRYQSTLQEDVFGYFSQSTVFGYFWRTIKHKICFILISWRNRVASCVRRITRLIDANK